MDKTYLGFVVALAPLFYLEALIFLQTEPELWFVSSAIIVFTSMVLAFIVAVCLSLIKEFMNFRTRHRDASASRN